MNCIARKDCKRGRDGTGEVAMELRRLEVVPAGRAGRPRKLAAGRTVELQSAELHNAGESIALDASGKLRPELLIIAVFFDFELICLESSFEVPTLAVIAADFVAVHLELDALEVGPVRPDDCQLPGARDVAVLGGSGEGLDSGEEQRNKADGQAPNCGGPDGGVFHWCYGLDAFHNTEQT